MDGHPPCVHQASEAPCAVRPSHSYFHPRVPRQPRVYDDRPRPSGGRHGVPVLERHRLQVSFLIGKNGIVYEGRGWFAEPDREIQYQALTDKCLDFAYIGNFKNEDPTWEMVRCLMDMIQYGLKRKYIKDSFKLINLRTNPYKIK